MSLRKWNNVKKNIVPQGNQLSIIELLNFPKKAMKGQFFWTKTAMLLQIRWLTPTIK